MVIVQKVWVRVKNKKLRWLSPLWNILCSERFFSEHFDSDCFANCPFLQKLLWIMTYKLHRIFFNSALLVFSIFIITRNIQLRQKYLSLLIWIILYRYINCNYLTAYNKKLSRPYLMKLLNMIIIVQSWFYCWLKVAIYVYIDVSLGFLTLTLWHYKQERQFKRRIFSLD